MTATRIFSIASGDLIAAIMNPNFIEAAILHHNPVLAPEGK